jgi:GntR family transcriptional regulator
MKRANLSDQIVTMLQKRIQSGVYKPAQLLPSIADLAEELSVGRSTLREALSRLETMGIIEIQHGRGVMVVEPKIDFSSRVKSFSETIREQGMTPGARVLFKGIEPADQGMAEKLCIQVGDPLVHLMRLRLAENLPVAVENSYVPCGLFPNLLEQPGIDGSLYDLLHQVYGREVAYAVRTVVAVLTTPEESKLLDLHGRQPALQIETVAMDDSRRPVDCGKSVYRADRFKFIVHQTR